MADGFKRSESYVRNVSARLIVDRAGEDAAQAPTEDQSAVAAQRGFWRQFPPLLDRTIRTTVRDRVNMLLRFAGPPILGASLVITFDRSIFALLKDNGGAYGSAVTMLYLVAAISLFLGAFTAGNAITSERAIFRRERLSGLSSTAYVLAKFAVLGTFSVLQSVLLVGVLAIGINFADFQTVLLVIGATSLTTLAGTTMGMLISSLSPNPDRASILIVLVLIPQLIFAGATVPRSEMSVASKLVSDITVSKWSLELSGLITNLEIREDKQAKFNIEIPGMGAVTAGIPRDLRTFNHAFIDERYVKWLVLSGFSVLFLGTTLVVQASKGGSFRLRR